MGRPSASTSVEPRSRSIISRGEIYATHGICTHALALLSEGWVEDGKIECPLHQGQFDIRTGKALCAPLTQDLRTYAVRLEGDNIFVDLDRHGEHPSSAGKRPIEARPRPMMPLRTMANRASLSAPGRPPQRPFARSAAPGINGAIDLVGDEPHLPYERPPLSKDMLLGRGNLDACTRLSGSMRSPGCAVCISASRRRSTPPGNRSSSRKAKPCPMTHC